MLSQYPLADTNFVSSLYYALTGTVKPIHRGLNQVKETCLTYSQLKCLVYAIHCVPTKTVVYPEAMSDVLQPGKTQYKVKWRLDN
jgi:hypothetical protein